MSRRMSTFLMGAGVLMCVMGLCGILVPYEVGEGSSSYLRAVVRHLTGYELMVPLRTRIEHRDFWGIMIPWILTWLGATFTYAGFRDRPPRTRP